MDSLPQVQLDGIDQRIDAGTVLLDDLGVSIQRSLRGSRRAGILLSSGLDSVAILYAALRLRERGIIDVVHAFHYSWQIKGLSTETKVVVDLCNLHDVELTVLDFTDLQLTELLSLHCDSRELSTQTFLYHITEAAIQAKNCNVRVLLTGVGAELAYGDKAYSREIVNSPQREAWPMELEPVERPDWLSPPRAPARKQEWTRGTPRQAAHQVLVKERARYCRILNREARILDGNPASTGVRVTHPFLSTNVLARTLAYPPYFNTFSYQGQLLDKGIIRLALRSAGDKALWLRTSSGHLEASEQKMLLEKRDWVAGHMRDSRLAELGIVNTDAVLRTITDEFKLKEDSTLLLPMLIVESWLRTGRPFADKLKFEESRKF